MKAPSDKGFKGLVVKEDNSPNSYWVRVDQSEIRRNRKHLFELHSNYSDNDKVESGLPSFEETDEVNDQSKGGDSSQEKITPEGEQNSAESSILNRDDNEEETSNIGDESETTPIVNEQESTPVKVSSRGRILKPPKRYDDVY